MIRRVLAKTRNRLRKAIKTAEQVLSRLKLKKHPDKTFIGWIKKGFDFLGYMFTTEGLQISVRCKERCRVKIIQLYERGANLFRIGLYWRNWVKWARCGLVDSSKTSMSHSFIKAKSLDQSQFVKDQLMNMVDLDIAAFQSDLVRYFKLIHFFNRYMESYYEKQQTKTTIHPINGKYIIVKTASQNTAGPAGRFYEHTIGRHYAY